jgi:hypothetical protein
MQRRVNVENAIGKGVQQGIADKPHEPSQTDEVHVTGAKKLGNGAIIGVAAREFTRVQMQRFNPRLARPEQTRRIGPIRYDDNDRRIEPALRDGVDDRLQIAATAGDEDGQPAAQFLRHAILS